MAEEKMAEVFGDFIKYPSGKFVTRKNILVMNSEELDKFFKGILTLKEVLPDQFFIDLTNQYTELKLNEEFNLINRIKYGEILYKNNTSYFGDILVDFMKDFGKTHSFEWVSYSGGIEGEYDSNSVKIPVEDYKYLKSHNIILMIKFPKNCKITTEVAKLLIEREITVSLGDVIVKTKKGEVHAFLFISPAGYVERPVGHGYIKINKISIDGWENGTESFLLSDSPFSDNGKRFKSIGSFIQLYDFAKLYTFDPFTQAELEVLKDFSSKKEKEFRDSIKDDSLTSLIEAIGKYYPTLRYGRWDTDPKFKENLSKFFNQEKIDEFIESHTSIWESSPFIEKEGKKITIPINKWNDLILKDPLSYEGVNFILPKTVEELELTTTLEECSNWFGSDGYGYLSPRDIKVLKDLNPSLKKVSLTI
jgi:hypothetical protein